MHLCNCFITTQFFKLLIKLIGSVIVAVEIIFKVRFEFFSLTGFSV